MYNNPLLIGVTGGIGAGKSVVCKIFESLGIPVYNADDRAKWLMAHDQWLMENIKSHFGKEAYLEGYGLNRTFLASVVFNNEDKLTQLNRLVHPKVGEDFALWIKKNPAPPYLIKEAALLFESGAYKQLNKVINVHAPASLRKTRVLSRDPYRKAPDIDNIIKRQLGDRQREEKADYNIINDDSNLVIPQVLRLHEQFKKMAAERPG